jgi:N-acyl homoserine lactone hydrolase
MKPLRIYPLNLGTITRPLVRFFPGFEPGIVGDLPLIAWYIEGSDKKILVDTGGGDPSQAIERWRPYKRESDQSLENALGKIGVRCEDVDIVIVTHLHWDHTGGNKLFPAAKMIVQEEELRYARTPEAAGACLPGIVEDVDYTVISGDTEIAKGVKAILTPGHTVALQGVLVQGMQRFFIAGDTLPLFKNLEQDPPAISNLLTNKEKYRESLVKITRLSAFVLPGHDFKVFEKGVYC